MYLVLLITVLTSCNGPNAPVAPRVASQTVIHGVSIDDPYKYLENPKDDRTIAHIGAENAYSDHYFRHISKFRDKLHKELEEWFDYYNRQGSVPVLEGDFFYYKRIPAGKDFAVHYRKQNNENAAEELLLDENDLAKGSGNFSLDELVISPDQSAFLYYYTTDGDNSRLIIRSNTNKTIIDSIITPVTSAVFSQDGRAVVYAKESKDILLHKINTPAGQDIIIYSEKRNSLFTEVERSTSGKYLFISSFNNESTEYSFIPADLSTLKPVLIDPLVQGRRYFADHFGSGFFMILSGPCNGNRSLYKVPVNTTRSVNWTTILEGSDSLCINSYTIIDQKFLLLFETKNLYSRLRLIDLETRGKDNQITFKEPDGQMDFLYFDRSKGKVAFSFSSLLTPLTAYNYDINSRKLTMLRRPAIKDYRKEDYIAELLWAKSADGTLIPLSVLHKNGLKRSDGLNPLYLEGYGSYGFSDHTGFSADLISLLDRGFFIATAHVRGGGELGNKWWESGKLLRKKNAIADYIASAEFLIKEGFTSKGMITAVGSSAGGIVIGAAVNERPELFKAALLMMPCVDLLTDLLDSIHQNNTRNEWREFGNPANRQEFEYILSYSPYNNIKKQEYPPMLFRTSPMDENQSYAGALKMVAKLRATASGKQAFFIRIDDRETHLGDTGKSGNLDFWSENRAFILDQYGINE